MKQIATVRLTEAVVRYGDHVPLATACCNACRTCVTTNAIGLVTSSAVVVTSRVARLFRRR